MNGEAGLAQGFKQGEEHAVIFCAAVEMGAVAIDEGCDGFDVEAGDLVDRLFEVVVHDDATIDGMGVGINMDIGKQGEAVRVGFGGPGEIRLEKEGRACRERGGQELAA